MELQQPQSLDAEIRTRLDALDRLAGVVAHDLGNVILPSSRLSGDASPELAKLHEKLDDLASHIMSTRRSLDVWRDHPRVHRLQLPLGEWWFGQCRLLGAVFDPPVQLRLDQSTDDRIRVDAGQLARTLALVLLAIELQAEAIEVIDVTIARHHETLRLELNTVHTNGADAPIAPPTLGEDLLGHGGSVDEFSTSRIALTLGPRS